MDRSTHYQRVTIALFQQSRCLETPLTMGFQKEATRVLSSSYWKAALKSRTQMTQPDLSNFTVSTKTCKIALPKADLQTWDGLVDMQDAKDCTGLKGENYCIIHKLEMGNFRSIMTNPKALKHTSITTTRKHMSQEVNIDSERERDKGFPCLKPCCHSKLRLVMV